MSRSFDESSNCWQRGDGLRFRGLSKSLGNEPEGGQDDALNVVPCTEKQLTAVGGKGPR